MTESCTTLIARELLHDLHVPHKLPVDLIDLVLTAIALDTADFKHGHETLDHQVAHQLLPFSSWHGQDLEETVKRLDSEMTKAKKDLGHLSVYELMRRDWKGDVRRGEDQHSVHLGFESVPTSLADMINRTASQTIDEYFKIESDFTLSIKADASACLTSFKDDDGNKRRELAVVVKAGHRLTPDLARSLFERIVEHVEASTELNATVWKGDVGESGHKRKVWDNNGGKNAGRKVVRVRLTPCCLVALTSDGKPIIEKAVQSWLDEHPHSLKPANA
jgi:exopolyphosphatase